MVEGTLGTVCRYPGYFRVNGGVLCRGARHAWHKMIQVREGRFLHSWGQVVHDEVQPLLGLKDRGAAMTPHAPSSLWPSGGFLRY